MRALSSCPPRRPRFSLARPTAGSKPVPSLLSFPHVHFLYLSQPPPFLRKLPFIVVAPIKIAHQVWSILRTLLWCIPHPPEFILVQVSFLSISAQGWYKEIAKNPPSIPTLALVWLVGTLRGSKVIIDWHNLGYSILALKLGPDHIFVKLARMSIRPPFPTQVAKLRLPSGLRQILVGSRMHTFS